MKFSLLVPATKIHQSLKTTQPHPKSQHNPSYPIDRQNVFILFDKLYFFLVKYIDKFGFIILLDKLIFDYFFTYFIFSFY